MKDEARDTLEEEFEVEALMLNSSGQVVLLMSQVELHVSREIDQLVSQSVANGAIDPPHLWGGRR